MTVVLVLILIVILLWLISRTNDASHRLKTLEAQITELRVLIGRLQRSQAAPATPPPLPQAPEFQPAPADPVRTQDLEPQRLAPQIEHAAVKPSAQPPVDKGPVRVPPLLAPAQLAKPKAPAINWESFLGVKLFAWVAGLALFLGVAFFVKHAFEHNLISPEMRVAIGYVTGIGLLVGGLLIPRPRHIVTVQTLCATGVLVLYAVTFAAHARYHFLGVIPTFGLMALVTATAFLLAVRLDAQVIAILGLLGGFLTPRLLSTGVDNPLGLFGYLALLDAGLIAMTLRKRWNHLVLLAAVATLVMQWAWVGKFFAEEKVLTGMAVFLGFAALFVGAFALTHRLKQVERWNSAAGILMPAAALGFALYLLVHPYPALAQRAGLLFGFVFLADLAFLAMAWLRDELRPTHMAAGGGVFLLLTIWTLRYLTADLLNAALACYLLFAVLHSVFPFVLQKLRPTAMSLDWVHLYPPLALLLILVPLFKLAAPSFLVWPVVLMIDLVAIVLAVVTASLVAILAVFVLTVLATAAWITQLPPSLPDVLGMLIVIGGFAVFFMAAGVLAARRVFNQAPVNTSANLLVLTPKLFNQLMSLAAALPFLLLTLVIMRLPLASPSSVFGLAALLVVLLLGLVRWYELDWLAPVGLLSVLLVEAAWHLHRFAPTPAFGTLAWYLGFGAVFLVFPFINRARFEKRLLPWVASALALPLHFTTVYREFKAVVPDFAYLGLVPAAFAIPCLLGLFRLARPWPIVEKERLTQVALFGGAALLFITLIFPIQFERQWITIGWALEGTALLWLFHRVPHAGLRLVGVGLLVASFVRLGLNPWVVTAYGRTGTPILNWYLYTYGIVTVCLMLGGRLLAPPRHSIGNLDVRPLLFGLGTVLAFALLNIEIADGFSPANGRLRFSFSAGLAQDMTYSIAWALFAFALLAVGFKLRNTPARYAGMGLLIVTLLKVFLHDLWQLGGLYRVGSLVGLAVILIVVSFIYQRFLTSDAVKEEKPPA